MFSAKFAMFGYGLIGKMNAYAAKKNMSTDEAIRSLLDGWEGGEAGLIRSIQEGDFANFLEVELEQH